jgi:hypothetical protein
MEPARFDERGDIKEGPWLATRRFGFSCAKSAANDYFALMLAVTERADAEFA